MIHPNKIKKCKNCKNNFRCKWSGNYNRYQQFCSKSCATIYRFKNKPESFKRHINISHQKHTTNGHLSFDEGLKMIRILASEGFLNQDNIKKALRRRDDVNI